MANDSAPDDEPKTLEEYQNALAQLGPKVTKAEKVRRGTERVPGPGLIDAFLETSGAPGVLRGSSEAYSAPPTREEVRLRTCLGNERAFLTWRRTPAVSPDNCLTL
jgi:hypothetical protein